MPLQHLCQLHVGNVSLENAGTWSGLCLVATPLLVWGCRPAWVSLQDTTLPTRARYVQPMQCGMFECLTLPKQRRSCQCGVRRHASGTAGCHSPSYPLCLPPPHVGPKNSIVTHLQSNPLKGDLIPGQQCLVAQTGRLDVCGLQRAYCNHDTGGNP